MRAIYRKLTRTERFVRWYTDVLIFILGGAALLAWLT